LLAGWPKLNLSQLLASEQDVASVEQNGILLDVVNQEHAVLSGVCGSRKDVALLQNEGSLLARTRCTALGNELAHVLRAANRMELLRRDVDLAEVGGSEKACFELRLEHASSVGRVDRVSDHAVLCHEAKQNVRFGAQVRQLRRRARLVGLALQQNEDRQQFMVVVVELAADGGYERLTQNGSRRNSGCGLHSDLHGERNKSVFVCAHVGQTEGFRSRP
jgi:hypothetical protein